MKIYFLCLTTNKLGSWVALTAEQAIAVMNYLQKQITTEVFLKVIEAISPDELASAVRMVNECFTVAPGLSV